jgi:hypothetical protein
MIHNHLSSGAGTIGQLVAEASSGLGLTPPHKIKKKITMLSVTLAGKNCIMRSFIT